MALGPIYRLSVVMLQMRSAEFSNQQSQDNNTSASTDNNRQVLTSSLIRLAGQYILSQTCISHVCLQVCRHSLPDSTWPTNILRLFCWPLQLFKHWGLGPKQTVRTPTIYIYIWNLRVDPKQSFLAIIVLESLSSKLVGWQPAILESKIARSRPLALTC